MAVITLKTVLPTFIILSTQHRRFAEGCTEPDPSKLGGHSKQQTCCCSGTLALAFFWGKRGADRLPGFVSSKLGRALSFCLAHIPLSPGTPRGGWDLPGFSEKRSPNETPQNQGTGKVTLCFFFFLHKCTDFSVLVRATQSSGGGRKQPWSTAAAFTQPEQGTAGGRSEDVEPNRSVQPLPPREAEASQLSTLKPRFAVVYQKQL